MSGSTDIRCMSRKRVLDIAGLGLLIPALGLAAYRFSPAFRATVLVFAGRAPNCPIGLAVKSDQMIRDHMALMNQFIQSSSLLQEDQGLKLWRTPRGNYWMPGGDKDVLMSVLAEQDHHVYGQGERGVHPGDVVLDCGAHVGVFTRVALKAGAKLVVAIEPAPQSLECLRRNLVDEIAAGKVIVYPKGVWDKNGTLTFHVDPANSANDSLVFGDQEKQDGDIQVPVSTIDSLVAELKLPRVDFIKMDIEGSERHAVSGAPQTLRTFRPRMALSAYHLPDDPVAVPRSVTSIVPDYKFDCGPCGEKEARIIPQTLLFH
jgi:FkbM family methyltransferase